MSEEPELCIRCGKPVSVRHNSERVCDNPDCEIHRYNKDRAGNIYNIRQAAVAKEVKGLTHCDDFVKTYDRIPTETELKVYVKMMDLIKSERLKSGIPLR